MATTSLLHVGNIGSVIKVTVRNEDLALDLSTATVKKMIFKKPTGVSVVKDAVFPSGGTGTDGVVQYTTVSGDLDSAGVWELQIYIEFATTKFYTDTTTFSVASNLRTVVVTP